jgi:precorrin-3B synthase
VCHPVRVLDQTLPAAPRRRPDRCPGITRPWLADDGALVRVRLVSGTLPTTALAALVDLATVFGDGDLHLTSRANLQLRAVPHTDGRLPDTFVEGVRAAGLLPSTSHELVRNVMTSALSGRLDGRADLRPVAADLDRLLLADPSCAELAGRFLFLLDDGRGDLLDRTSDLAVVALDGTSGQLRAGSDQWGPVLRLDDAAAALHDLTRRFLDARGSGPTAAWHVDELDGPLLTGERDPRSRVTSGPPPYGVLVQGDGRLVEHLEVPEGRITPDLAAHVLGRAGDEVVVTRWRSVLLPDLENR